MLTSSARRLAAFQCAHHTIDTPNAITTHVPYKLILGHDAIAIILAQWGAVTAPIRFPGEVVTWVPAFQHGTRGQTAVGLLDAFSGSNSYMADARTLALPLAGSGDHD